MNASNLLTQGELQKRVPAAFATEAHPERSDRYQLVDTQGIITAFADEGWFPTYASQVGASDTGKHMIRFRQDGGKSLTQVDETRTEIVLLNSHNGTSTMKLDAGVYRLACANGMIVCDSKIDTYSIQHFTRNADLIKEAINGIMTQTPIIAESVERFSSIQMDMSQRLSFAQDCLEIIQPRSKDDKKVTVYDVEGMIKPIRYSDEEPTLWNSLNCIQEKIIRGGITGFSTNEQGRTRQVTRKPITSIDTNKRVNKRLWNAANEFYEKMVA